VDFPEFSCFEPLFSDSSSSLTSSPICPLSPWVCQSKFLLLAPNLCKVSLAYNVSWACLSARSVRLSVSSAVKWALFPQDGRNWIKDPRMGF
jgi:hypothetical protein